LTRNRELRPRGGRSPWRAFYRPDGVEIDVEEAEENVKAHTLRSGGEVLKEHLRDPAFRDRWQRTALARAVALRLVAYRADNGLSQTALARLLGMKQPAVARLEAGEKNPSWETLARISKALGMEFVIDIVPRGRRGFVERLAGTTKVVERGSGQGADLVVAVA
jgi:DNA-binding XRE family transcriptional regulator